ncbi:Cna protein B-type domain protein [Leptospira sp. GIMC2001]|uniref:Cna protein B-type domain protein n=1 Tax=Leptospira sp. GIMC2001 TaxID=1513297 RepID=UPI00234A5716|nr:Cna protein B-type domain protein [Leptospira sp. GIMC2001]WCL49937.1 Cna protein B-type domain protein [Leptospira sp. GIMC2001]
MKSFLSSFIRIFLYSFILASFAFTVGCSGKKKDSAFWLLLLGAGGGSAGQDAAQDANGETLPENLGTNPQAGQNGDGIPQSNAQQEVATSGPATINGTIIPVIANSSSNDVCGQPGSPNHPHCVNLSLIQVQLVAPNGTVIQVVNLNSDGSFSFDIENLPNNNYRVLIESGYGLNYTFADFNFTHNPTAPGGITEVSLGEIYAERAFYTSGPALITGSVITGGFNGDVVVSAGPLSGLTVNFMSQDGTILATTVTDASGNYEFSFANLENSHYNIEILGDSGNQPHGLPFADIVQDIRFQFEGSIPSNVTHLTAPTSSLNWMSATTSSISVTGNVYNAAVNSDSTTIYNLQLIVPSGNVVATASINGAGAYSLSASNLAAGVYSVQAVGSNNGTTITYPASSSFLFTPHSAGSVRTQSSVNLFVVPKPSNITGRVEHGALNYVPGSVINFRPAADQPPANLLYLLQDDEIRDLIKLWLSQSNANVLNNCVLQGNFSSSCIQTNQGAGPWNYSTYGNKVYEVRSSDLSVFFEAVAGKWAYYVSAPGYANYCGIETDCSTNPLVLTLNGIDYNAGTISMTPSDRRSQIAGSITVRDQIVNSAVATNYTNLTGLFVILLGNTNSNGDPIAHITVTVGGSYSFGGSSKVVTLPAGLPNDQARAGVAINAFVGMQVIPGLPVLGAINLSNATSVVGETIGDSIYKSGETYNFRQSSYQVLVVDPLSHTTASSFGADNSSVATNSYATVPPILILNSTLNHLPRKQITGNVFNAISTAGITSASITIGRYNDSGSFVQDIRRDCSSSDTSSGFNCSIPSGNRLDQPKIDQALSSISVDGNGNFMINNINPGNYVLRIQATGFQDQDIEVIVPPVGTVPPVTVPLVPNVGVGTLAGSVKLPGGFNFVGTYFLDIVHPVSNNRPLAGVQPNSLSSGSASFSNAPQYSVFNLSAGQWKVRFVSAGYQTVEGIVNIQANAVTNFDIITMVPGSHNPASISGRAINAIYNNSSGMNGLTVRLRPGVNVTSGAYATAIDGVTTLPASTTATDGSFAITNVPPGNYTLEVSGSSIATAYRTVISAGNDTPSNQNILVTPVLSNDEMRIVLSWNAKPRDLDSHLEFGSSKPHQVVWNDRNKLGGDAKLDVDVVNGFGPETVTLKGSAWSQTRRGYSIYNWSNEANMSTSGAVIRVYKKTGLVRTYSVGSGQISRWWQIFCLNPDQSIVDVGGAGCSANSFFNAHMN